MDKDERNLQGEEDAIHRILLRIHEKWRAESNLKEEGLLTETIILSPEPATPPTLEPPIEEEAFVATVILSPNARQSISSPAPTKEESETTGVESKTGEPPEKGEFLEETVILKPKKVEK